MLKCFFEFIAQIQKRQEEIERLKKEEIERQLVEDETFRQEEERLRQEEEERLRQEEEERLRQEDDLSEFEEWHDEVENGSKNLDTPILTVDPVSDDNNGELNHYGKNEGADHAHTLHAKRYPVRLQDAELSISRRESIPKKVANPPEVAGRSCQTSAGGARKGATKEESLRESK